MLAWGTLWYLPKSQEEFLAQLQLCEEQEAKRRSIDEDDDNEDDNNEDDVVHRYKVELTQNRMKLEHIRREHQEHIARLKFLSEHNFLEGRSVEVTFRRDEIKTYDERRRNILQRIAEIEGELCCL